MSQTKETFNLKGILSAWGISFGRELPELPLSGSPERTEFRTVVQAQDGERFVLERVPSSAREHKEHICFILDKLQHNGIEVVSAYRRLKDKTDGFIFSSPDGSFWQLAQYCEGEPLDRGRYFNDAWRGKAAAQVLAGLRHASAHISADGIRRTSLKDYVEGLIRHLAHSRPDVWRDIGPVNLFLEQEFFPCHDRWEEAFCHGDFHPVNIIWGRHKINGLIDWEFTGIKPELYDAATFIGCVGIDGPRAVISPLVRAFLADLAAAGIIRESSWPHLLALVLAVRMAFLAEWVRLSNSEMIAFETGYMNYILKSRAVITHQWDA